MQQLRGLVPDLLDRHGLSEEVLIDKYLRPLLTAKETIFFQKDGKVKQRVNVAALGIRLSSLRTAFELHGSYAPKDPKEAAQFGNTVVIVDIPRPPRNAIDVTPRVAGGKRQATIRRQRTRLKIYTLPTRFLQDWKAYIRLRNP